MKNLTLSLSNQDTVKCSECGKKHIIIGFEGNNQGWKDRTGWRGIGYDARGFIDTFEVHAVCPQCLSGLKSTDLMTLQTARLLGFDL